MKQTITIIISFIVGLIIGSFTTYMTTIGGVKSQNQLVAKSIEKPTTSIDNSFSTEIKKLKNRKGNIDLDTKPTIDKDLEVEQLEPNKKRRKFWKRKK